MYPTQELTKLIKTYLEYFNGKLYWRRTTSRRSTKGSYAGDGACKKIKLKNMYVSKSRIIFYFVNGYLPPYVAFIDGDNTNYSPDNLKEFKANSRNTSGYMGVSLSKATGLWVAQLSRDRKMILNKLYNTKDEAYESYSTALMEYNQRKVKDPA